MRSRRGREQRQEDQQQDKQSDGAQPCPPWDGEPQSPGYGDRDAPAQPQPRKAAHGDGCNLSHRTRPENDDQHGGNGDAGPLAVGTQAAGHAPDRLSDHGHSDDLEAMQQAVVEPSLNCGHPTRK